MHATAFGVSREERIKQVKRNDPTINNFSTYISNGKAVVKIKKWKQQGAEIFYLTSRRTISEIEIIRDILAKYQFPDYSNLLSRKNNENYKDIAEKLMPDILIEDDCESIGGESEMTYSHIRPELKPRIKSIIVKEFAGIDDLPDNIEDFS